MPFAALGFLLFAGALHATLQLVIKRSTSPLLVLWGSFVFVAVALAAPFAYVVAMEGGLPGRAVPWLLFSVAADTGYVLALSRAYERGDLSVVYPTIRGTGLLLIPFVAFALLDERVSARGGVGIALVALGVILAQMAGAESSRPRLRGEVLTCAFAGVAMSAYSVADKAALASAPLLLYLYLDFALLALTLSPFAVRRWGEFVDGWRSGVLRRNVLAAGVLTPVITTLVFLGLRRAEASYVAPVREVSIVFAAVLGRFVLGESGWARIGAAAVVVAGVVFIAGA